MQDDEQQSRREAVRRVLAGEPVAAVAADLGRSKERTVKAKCSGWPPVSPSKISGLVVTSNSSLTPCSRDEMSTASMSGLPRDVESVKDDDHIPSKRAIRLAPPMPRCRGDGRECSGGGSGLPQGVGRTQRVVPG